MTRGGRRPGSTGLLGVLLVAASGASTARAETTAEWTVSKALKHIDRVTEHARGLTGEVDWDEVTGNRRIQGSGRLWVDLLSGSMRGEIGGDNPRTVIVAWMQVHRYNEVTRTAKTYQAADHPDLLVQYLPLGFEPRGSALKQQFKVESVTAVPLDGRQTLQLVLKPKDRRVARSLPFLELWIDPTSGFPVQTALRHATSEMKITVRFRDLAPAADLDPALFQPSWPEGTTTDGMP